MMETACDITLKIPGSQELLKVAPACILDHLFMQLVVIFLRMMHAVGERFALYAEGEGGCQKDTAIYPSTL